MIFQAILEGMGLGALLVLVCWLGIRRGAVGMAHLYHEDVQARCVQLGLTTREKIRRSAKTFKLCCMPIYLPTCLSLSTLSTAQGTFSRASGSCSSCCLS